MSRRKPNTQQRPGSTEQVPTADEWAKAEQRAKPRTRRCGFCGEPGHLLRTCPRYLRQHR